MILVSWVEEIVAQRNHMASRATFTSDLKATHTLRRI